MKIGVLTGSRADFGIYLPLLKELEKDPFFTIEVIAFGTHLSEKHGFTIDEIKNSFSGDIIQIKSPVVDINANSIAVSYGKTVGVFAEFWNQTNYDLVLCLGDRYEMSAAIQASIPYAIPLAHFHGGETTLGAIDNIYRHQITLASKYHFTATEEFGERVTQLLDSRIKNVFPVGSVSLADLNTLSLLNQEEFKAKYNLPDLPFILCTFHPETEDPTVNESLSNEMYKALLAIPVTHHVLVSMPNADTSASQLRTKLEELKSGYPDRFTMIESFGKINYFSAMKSCAFLLGNSSSGIIEAASFGKMVLNVGRRQEGRLQSGNVIDVPFECEKINSAIFELIEHPRNFSGENKYVKDNTNEKVIEILRSIGNGEL